MAYSRQVDRILAGGLSFLPSTDLTAPQDSAVLNNWRSDQNGTLRSREGLQTVSGVTAHSLFRWGNDRYAGVGTTLVTGASHGTGVDTGFDGNPLGFAAYQEFVWVMNRSKQVRVTGSTSVSWGLAAPSGAPTTAAGAAGNITGEVIHYVTFVAAGGAETNGGPGSTPLTLAAEAADLTSIPVSADAQVVKRRIYRIGGGLISALRVGEIDDNTTTIFTDDLSDDAAIELDLSMPLDNEGPPAASWVMGPYFGKLLAGSTAAQPARLFWTPTAQPYFFPGSDDDAEGNWLDVGDKGDELIMGTNHTRYAVLYKQMSIWRLIGDPDTNDPELVSTAHSPVSRRAIVNTGDVDYFVGHDGVYRFNGDTVVKVSQKVDPIFRGYNAPLASGQNAVPLDAGNYATVALGFKAGLLYVSYVTSGSTQETLVLNTETGDWSRMTSVDGGFHAFFYEGHLNGAFPVLTAASRAGGVYSVAGGTSGSDAGGAIPLYWQSRFMDQGAPDAQKRYGEVAIEYVTDLAGVSAATLTVDAIYDNGTVENLGTISSTSRTWARFRLGTGAQGRKASNIAIRISGDTSSVVIIYKTLLFFYAEARLARSFDSGVIDLGTHLVKTAYRMELNFEAGSTVSWDVWTDVTGDAMATRDTGTITSSAGRRTAVVDLDPVDGRFFRLMFFSTGDFQLHGLRIEIQPMGVFVDTTRPYETEALYFA